MAQVAGVPNVLNFCLPVPQDLFNDLIELEPFIVRLEAPPRLQSVLDA